MALLIVNYDKYETKSIDKLHYMFLAGLSHDKWHKLKFEHDAAMHIKSFVSWEYVVHREPEATYAFQSQKNHSVYFNHF